MKVFVIFSICIGAAMSKRFLTSKEKSILDDESHKSIIGGRPAKESTAQKYFEFPWMVSLHFNGKFKCSSFLITPKFLMTAAHCVVVDKRNPTARDPKDFKAYTGTVKRDGPDNEVTFSEIIVHEKYACIASRMYASCNNDIALMKFAKPVALSYNIQTICLPTKDSVYEDTTAQAMGWGAAEKRSGQSSKTLQTVTEKVPTNSMCNAAYNRVNHQTDKIFVTRRHVCAGGAESQGICYGDSGGPLVAMNEAKPVAIGIASFASILGCAVYTVPAVYTATSMYTDWIVENMGEDANDLCFLNKTSTPTRG